MATFIGIIIYFVVGLIITIIFRYFDNDVYWEDCEGIVTVIMWPMVVIVFFILGLSKIIEWTTKPRFGKNKKTIKEKDDVPILDKKSRWIDSCNK